MQWISSAPTHQEGTGSQEDIASSSHCPVYKEGAGSCACTPPYSNACRPAIYGSARGSIFSIFPGRDCRAHDGTIEDFAMESARPASERTRAVCWPCCSGYWCFEQVSGREGEWRFHEDESTSSICHVSIWQSAAGHPGSFG